ncbi:MAG: hypothetical protein JWO05_3144 [Gemmatimonadetes bacterium]|nr:hypothetical protein [Gemmatimonadota bacterium]
MRVGILADSHDRVPAIAELVRRMAAAGISTILHAGDYCSPFALAPIADAHMSLAGVFGRNDGDPQGLLARAQTGFGVEIFESPHSFEIGGHQVLLVHDIAEVQARSLESHGVVIHGFTHRQEMKTRGDTLLLNPGESCGWVYGTPQAAILDLQTKNVEFLTLDASEWTR